MTDKQEMPKNPESVALSFKQTAKGFWYIDKLGATGASVDSMFKQLDVLVKGAVKRLIMLNEVEEVQQ